MALNEKPGATPVITADDNNVQWHIKHSPHFRLFSVDSLMWNQKNPLCSSIAFYISQFPNIAFTLS